MSPYVSTLPLGFKDQKKKKWIFKDENYSTKN